MLTIVSFEANPSTDPNQDLVGLRGNFLGVLLHICMCKKEGENSRATKQFQSQMFELLRNFLVTT